LRRGKEGKKGWIRRARKREKGDLGANERYGNLFRKKRAKIEESALRASKRTRSHANAKKEEKQSGIGGNRRKKPKRKTGEEETPKEKRQKAAPNRRGFNKESRGRVNCPRRR